MAVLSQATRTILNGESVASTGYTYNTTASSGANHGWIDTKYNDILFQIGVATLNATSLTYRVEGRANSNSRAGEIVTASLNAVSTIDTFIEISERVGQVRVGHKINNTATPNNVYSRLVMTELH